MTAQQGEGAGQADAASAVGPVRPGKHVPPPKKPEPCAAKTPPPAMPRSKLLGK